jgi:hypothetical protein
MVFGYTVKFHKLTYIMMLHELPRTPHEMLTVIKDDRHKVATPMNVSDSIG